MTNIYLTDSDEEAIVDFVKDHEQLYNKTNDHFKDKAWKEVRGSPTATSCLSGVQDLVQIPKDWLRQTHAFQV